MESLIRRLTAPKKSQWLSFSVIITDVHTRLETPKTAQNLCVTRLEHFSKHEPCQAQNTREWRHKMLSAGVVDVICIPFAQRNETAK
jgi:hypothetical protein